MRFTDIFVQRPVLSIVISLIILLIGARALVDMPVRQYPFIESGTITVSTAYPGASPELMQGFVTTPIAQAIATADGVEYISSNSTQGGSSVSARLRVGADTDRALTDVMTKVDEISYLLPQESQNPIISKSSGDEIALIYVGFASDTIPLPGITDYIIRVIQPMLSTINGVGKIDLIGAQTLAMRVWIDPAKMAARGLSAADVATALRANNYQSAAGQIKSGNTVTNIDINTDLTDVKEFQSMVIHEDPATGALVRLQDIATLELGAKSYDQTAMLSGQKAVYIGVYATPSGNPLTIIDDVKSRLEKLKPEMPPGLRYAAPYDVSIFIKGAIEEVVKTLAEAVAIVVVVIFLFLGTFRSVIIPIVTIPLSLMGACALMLAFGFSFNLLTLLAMVMAIGLVVDDAIVVVENVYRHVEEGLSPFQAALTGAREIAMPIVAMTITLAAVYAPIGFMGGVTGTLFREFAFTLAGAVIVSGIIALTLSPMMCAVFLKKGMNETGFAARVEHTFGRIENRYAKWLSGTISYRPVTLTFAVFVMLTLALLYNGAQKELAPEEDPGVVIAIVKAPEYANVDYLETYTKRLNAIFQELPEVNESFVLNGTLGPSGGFAGFTMKPWDQRDRSAKQIQEAVQQQAGQIEGMNTFVILPSPLPASSGGMPVQMVIQSTQTPSQVFAQMETIKQEAQKTGLFIVTDSDLSFSTPTARLKVDHTKANQLGVKLSDVGDTLALMLGGNYINRFGYQGRSYEVIPQVLRQDRQNADKLGNYYVRGQNGQMIPLSAIVTSEIVTAPKSILQFNQQNSATFSAVPLPGVSIGQTVAALQDITKRVLPEGYLIDWQGDSRQFVQEGNQLMMTFALAIVFIFLILAAQFESWRDPLVVMVTVPLAISGALIPLFFGVTSVNIYSQIGLVTLIGLISKHGILMVEFANNLQLQKGMDRAKAIQEAAKVRLRPILMTTAAMVVGLVPLVVASGPGAVSRFSIGIVIIVGMLVGTLFTLFILPAVYTLIAKDHNTHRQEPAIPAQPATPDEQPIF
ncbi:MAG: efflux RND transporter permease subunit [Pseudomonadota bacterium]